MTKILIPQNIKARIDALVRAEPREFTLWGKARNENGNLILVDFYIPKQKSTSAHTEIEEVGMGEMILDLVKNRKENVQEWCVWIHSHNTMGAFWSKTDEDTIAQMGKDLQCPYMGAIVVSTTSCKGAIGIYEPFNVWQNVDIEVIPSLFTPEEEAYITRKNEIEEAYKNMKLELEELSPFKDELALLKERNEVETTYVSKYYNKNYKPAPFDEYEGYYPPRKYNKVGEEYDDLDDGLAPVGEREGDLPTETIGDDVIGRTLTKKEFKRIKNNTCGVEFENGWSIWGNYLWKSKDSEEVSDYSFKDIRNLIVTDAY